MSTFSISPPTAAPRRQHAALIVILAAAALSMAAVWCSVPAGAAIRGDAAPTVTVSVGWDGADCIDMWEPDPATGGTTVVSTTSCDPDKGLAIRYPAPPVGAWVGVDPVEADGVALSCQLRVNGSLVAMHAGFVGVTCLGRW